MNVPASAPASANSIVVQHRTKPLHANRDKDDHYTIPPMSIVFAHSDSGVVDCVRDVSAHADCAPLTTDDELEGGKFRGVSLQAVNGREARRFKNNDRFTVITRGEATIMVPYEDVQNIDLGDFVRVKKTANASKCFRGFEKTPTLSIEKIATNEPGVTIGKLIRKSTPRNKENLATVLLF